MRNTRLVAVFAVALLVFVLLRSSDYMMVDGAVRSLEVMRHPALFFHGNNHLLYPAYILGWTRLLGALGLGVTSPVDYIHAAQLLNALAAAVTVTALCWLILRASGSWILAVLGASAFALSRAMLLHATNGAEPVTGLMWSALATVLVVQSVDRRSAATAAAGGAALALAMASYQSMVLIGPGLLLYVWLATPRGARARSTVSLLGAAALATAIVYGWAYAREGVTTPGAMLSRFFTMDGAPGVYGGLRITKVPSLFLGLAYGLVPVLPPTWLGWRGMLRGELGALDMARVLFGVVIGVTCAGWLAWQVWRQGRAAPQGARVAWVAGAVALLGCLVPALLWDTLYEKLWLQPIAIGVVGACAALGMPGAVARRSRIAIVVLGALGAAVNLATAVRARVAPPTCRAEAEAVARLVGASDLLVHEWDPVSFDLHVYVAGERQMFDLVSEARDRGAGAAQALDYAKRATWERGGAVFYLGAFDLSRERWEAFLGGRAGLPYDALAAARAHAKLVETLSCRGARVTLWREVGPGGFEPPTNGGS